ncbi:MAG: hypothetical protein ACRC28_19205 [Clostridium sp.]|uniref:hypothetical protein n=1 Tax=Clostridium sp. TaxID=1506 RepID=UPI003F32C099
MVSNLNLSNNENILKTRKEKARLKKAKRRRLLFLFFIIFLTASLFIVFNTLNKNNKLSSSKSALEHYLLDGAVPELSRIDNSELVFSQIDKSIYKVSGVDSSNTFNYLEVCLTKDDSTWKLEYLKNLK